MERLDFSSWIWWCDSGGSVPGETFHGGFLDGWGSGGPRVNFCHISLPSAISWFVFPVKFFLIAAVLFLFMLSLEWVYSLSAVPGVHIFPFLVQYAWFISTNCVAKLGWRSDKR